MKKLFSILILFSLVLSVSSQTTLTHTNTSGTTKTSTYTNADTGFHKMDLSGQINNYDVITIHLIGTKVSGTVGGTAVPFGSIDGTRWAQIYDKDSVSSQTLANSDNDKYWQFDKTRWQYIRIRVYTPSSQVSTVVVKGIGRKLPTIN